MQLLTPVNSRETIPLSHTRHGRHQTKMSFDTLYFGLHFADKIVEVGTRTVVPISLVHVHAILGGATGWLATAPVCVVPGGPIRPNPGALQLLVVLHIGTLFCVFFLLENYREP